MTEKARISLAEYITRAPSGWEAAGQESSRNEKTIDEEESEVSDRDSRKAWVRLLTKVYETAPMVCPKCGSEMRVIAVIRNPPEIRKILKHPGCMAEQQRSCDQAMKDRPSSPRCGLFKYCSLIISCVHFRERSMLFNVENVRNHTICLKIK